MSTCARSAQAMPATPIDASADRAEFRRRRRERSIRPQRLIGVDNQTIESGRGDPHRPGNECGQRRTAQPVGFDFGAYAGTTHFEQLHRADQRQCRAILRGFDQRDLRQTMTRCSAPTRSTPGDRSSRITPVDDHRRQYLRSIHRSGDHFHWHTSSGSASRVHGHFPRRRFVPSKVCRTGDQYEVDTTSNSTR